MKIKLITVLLFVILEFVGYVFIINLRDAKINSLLNFEIRQTKMLLKSIEKSFDEQAKLMAYRFIDWKLPEILKQQEINRQNINNFVQNEFTFYHSKFGISQLRFYLKNNNLLLKIPENSNKNMSDYFINQLVSSNKFVKKSYFRGFQECSSGICLNYIYPINLNQTFFGFLEISFPFKTLIKKAGKILPYNYDFLIQKQYVLNTNNFLQNELNSNFLTLPHRLENNVTTIKNINQKIKQKVKTKINKLEEFAVYTHHENSPKKSIAIFLPMSNLENQFIGYFTVYVEDNIFLQRECKHFNNRIILFTIAAIFLSIIFYYFIVTHQKLGDFNNILKRQLKDEIKRSKAKDQLLFEQSKFSAISEVINLLSHQWRQPLNRISLKLINIEDDFNYNELTEEVLSDYCSEINRDIQFISKTISDLREYYKPIIRQETVSLFSTIDSVISMIKENLRNTGIDIQLNFQANKEIQINYAKELKEVLKNILDNAIEVVDDETGKIIVSVEKIKHKIIIKIKDNGKGIPDDIKSRIFEPYFTTKFENQGTGLGLYISKIMVEFGMQGSLSVANNLNENGATFILKLSI